MHDVALRLDNVLWSLAGRLVRHDLTVPVSGRDDDYSGASFGFWLLLAALLAVPVALIGPRNWVGTGVKAAVIAVPASMAMLRGVYDGVGQRRGYTRGGCPWLCMYAIAAAGAVAALQP